MKHIINNTVALFIVCFGFTACGQKPDAVKKANATNEIKADNNMVDEDVAEFLVKSADARMMGSREGMLAIEKSKTVAVREYGRLMITEQAMLLAEIKKLAAKYTITLPDNISNKKESGREDLAAKEEEDFDTKFIKMMTIDHERDIKLFEKATEFNNKEVSAFAKSRLPIIQKHLIKIKEIKEAIPH